MPSKKGAAAQPPNCLRCSFPTSLASEKHGDFELRVYRCRKCGWSMTHPEDANMLLMRERGVRASLGKLGRQTILRIPASIREIYKLDKRKELVLKPVGRKKIEIEI